LAREKKKKKKKKELLSIQEQTSKIADLIRAGSDKARSLEFEVEKILLKFQGDTKMSISDTNEQVAAYKFLP
jgi:hypothetical protein